MITKTTIALAAALVLGSASAALAQSADTDVTPGVREYMRNPSAPVPIFRSNPDQHAVIEGRNVGIQRSLDRAAEERWFNQRTAGVGQF